MRRMLLALALAACDSAPGPEAPGPLAEARGRFPSFIDLHQGVIARSCSPNPGVCHNSGNVPDLSTPRNMLAIIGAPCNTEIPDPRQGWNACERAADHLVAGDLERALAWTERLERGVWRLGLRAPATFTGTSAVRFTHADGSAALDLSIGPDRESAWLELGLRAGSLTATVSVESIALRADYRARYDGALAALIPGDPSRDGSYGAEADLHAAQIVPADLARSYLWRRVSGTAPGSRMPLANQALSAPEYAALACWIHGLDRPANQAPASAIDYARCAEELSFEIPYPD